MPKHALVLSGDDLVRGLLAELLSLHGMTALEAADVPAAGVLCRSHAIDVILVDAAGDGRIARALLDDPWTELGERQPPFVVLASPARAPALSAHAWIDRLLTVPVPGDEIAAAVCYHASGRARREMRLGVRARDAVDQTFQTKRKTLRPGEVG